VRRKGGRKLIPCSGKKPALEKFDYEGRRQPNPPRHIWGRLGLGKKKRLQLREEEKGRREQL